MFVKIGVIIIAKKYYWLKLKEDFFRQKEIKKLRKIAGGDTYTIIYLKMMLLSLKDEGKLFFEGLEDSFIDEIALEIDEDLENVKVTIMFLIKCRLIEELTENEFLMTKAYESIGSETQSAERVRRFRQRKKRYLVTVR
ncbi:phage replisome organizer N-terminal domain-containing protein [Clostridium botulinum]|nr:phage replisome organizer N-terminal domain-containing protein [Clostridium botulinum]MCS4469386.1 phage replisome organizer N-terminal domain-containing protein [Clostridium botulinum]MCS4517054.1 phage replisome organizer N-terminal domain-containing protein [Clostridium botulinum]MCS4522372.1 phage replisome organizer N-terminal domain-containing protein [Clostridium botulinum]MCS4524868.1 phage replisome organizer N-terminal domain-containing protein [Clostridium botulinum]